MNDINKLREMFTSEHLKGSTFDLDLLRRFYVVAKAGSASKAAQILGMTQPALSRQISLLERSIGAELFFRHQKGLKPTQQGDILLESTEKILTEAAKVNNILKAENQHINRPLKVVTTVAISSMVLPHYLPRFLVQHPDIKLEIVASNEFPDWKTGEADVVIWTLHEKDKDLISHRLTTYHMKLYASREYLNQYGTPKTVEDLSSHRLLGFGRTPSHATYDLNWHLKLGRDPKNLHIPYLTLSNTHGLMRLAENGAGIVSLSKEIYQQEKTNLISILPEIEGPKGTTYLSYPTELKKMNSIQSLYSFLKDAIKETP